MSTELTPPRSPAEVSGRLQFTGQTSELFGIWIVNLLLTLVTLGIYRFWGRTRVRRFLWSHTSLKGDPFEYVGTGGELFIGFLIATFAIFIPLGLIGFAAQFLLQGANPALGVALVFALYLLIYYLLGFAIYSARRYRLSRTYWRGIRGGLEGTRTHYALNFFAYLFLDGMTLFMTAPYTSVALWRYSLNNTTFGTGRFKFEGTSGPVYGPFFAAIGMGLGIVIFVAIIGSVFAAGLGGSGAGEGAAIFFVFLGYLLIPIPVIYYQAAFIRHIVSCTSFEGVTFSVPGLTAGRLIAFTYVNLFILLFTLGLGIPLVQIRTARLMADVLEIHGEPDYEKLMQSVAEKPRFGEGLAEGFEIGTI